MCSLDQNTARLLSRYEFSLEKQIAGGGSSLVCQDEMLWEEIEAMLKDGDARYAHSLGLDPLKVMEESLKATQDPVGGGRGGLKGLAKAFEILEQAALNLYLSPWREEYKVVKMYSGIVTHYVKPVLSLPQILRLFGLLGYQPSPGKMEQLHREPLAASFTGQDDLLRLSCAFFLARCECLLLLSALGGYAGHADWELSLVCERQRGHCVQMSLDNVRKTLEVDHLPKGDLMISGLDSEQDLDLYTAADVPSAKPAMAPDDEGPRSLSWGLHHNTAVPTSAKPHGNGVTPPSSLSVPQQPGKPVCVTTLHHQVMVPPGPSSTGSYASVAAKHAGGRLYESEFAKQPDSSHGAAAQAPGASSPSDAALFCSCMGRNGVCHQPCPVCSSSRSGSLLTMTSDFPQKCQMSDRSVTAPNRPTTDAVGDASGRREYRTELPENPHLMSQIKPISYHDCCDLAHPDPDYTCLSCWVFHNKSCKGLKYCREAFHDVNELRTCTCGRYCTRQPLVLCRYCGTEYCIPCWYKNPVACACGQTFDQSSPV